ncbi:MAG: hypothetical protein V4558_04090 [Gemmatimonadota bacterium]
MKAELAIAIVAAITGIAALVVAILSNRVSSREARRGNLLQERMLALESHREGVRRRESDIALVVAALAPGDAFAHPRLVIRNRGPATATGIAVLIDGTPILQHDEHFGPDQEVPPLGPGGEFEYRLFITATSSTLARKVDLRWTNADGTDDANVTTIQP